MVCYVCEYHMPSLAFLDANGVRIVLCADCAVAFELGQANPLVKLEAAEDLRFPPEDLDDERLGEDMEEQAMPESLDMWFDEPTLDDDSEWGEDDDDIPDDDWGDDFL